MSLLSSAISLAALLAFSAPAVAAAGDPPARGGAVRFATAVAVAGDQILVGRPGASARTDAPLGGVHVFRRNGSGPWAEIAVVVPKDLAAGDDFGVSLAVEGTLLAVGAPGSAEGRGAIYLFERDGKGRWTERARLTAAAGAAGDRLGAVVALRDGLLIAGAPDHAESQGQVVVFRRGKDKAWTESATLKSTDGAPQGRFGRAVAVTDGLLLVGAPGVTSGNPSMWQPGRVLAFRDSSGTWVPDTTFKLEADSTVRAFGAVLLADGSDLWVSSPLAENGVGAVFHFRRNGGTWTKVARLAPATGATAGPAVFGAALARDGQDLLVGAPFTEQGAGAIHVLRYDASTAAWTEVQRLSLPAMAGARLGDKLAVAGGTIVAAAPRVGGTEGAGVVFHRDGAGGQWREIGTVADTAWNVQRVVTGGAVKCEGGKVRGVFDCQNTELVSFLPVSAIGGKPGVSMSDVWGWHDSTTGREFALVARSDGMAFVEVTDPANPKYLGNLPMRAGTRPSAWRSVKSYKNHAFIVADLAGAHGMQIFDLTQLRDVKDAPVLFQETAHYDRINSAHTIVMNEETGFVYPAGNSMGGETCGGGLHMIDVRDPVKPVFAGCYAEPTTGRNRTGYVHDAQCVTYRGPDEQYKGREICVNSAETAISIADVTDKAQPKTLSVTPYPSVGYTHQGWFTEDMRYFFVNDELDEVSGNAPRTRTIVFDLNDLDQPVVLHEFQGTTPASDHNLYIRGRYMYQANYKVGLRVIDVADPKNPKEVGYFDTVPGDDNAAGFDGAWTNYPFFKSGVVGVTSMREGFFLVRYLPPAMTP